MSENARGEAFAWWPMYRATTPRLAFLTRIVVTAFALWLGQVVAALASDNDVRVNVVKSGNAATVDAILFAPVEPRLAWEVLVDFDRMAAFVPNLTDSRVVSKPGEPLVIEQRGVARYGPFRFSFDTKRGVELKPFERIHTRLISGNMRKFEATMRLSAVDGGTRMLYHSEAVTDFWLPPLLGPAFIRHEAEEQFIAMIGEMKQRNNGGKPR